jgi:hypothetical protein
VQINVVIQIVSGFIAFFFLEKQVASKLHPSGIIFFGLKKISYEF